MAVYFLRFAGTYFSAIGCLLRGFKNCQPDSEAIMD